MELAAKTSMVRVDHTGFTVKSLQESVNFFVDVLGFKIVNQEHFGPSEFLSNVVGVPDAEMTLAMLELDGHLVELLEYTAPNPRNIVRPRSCDIGSVHLAFYVVDLEDVVRRVELVGWHRLGALQTVASGARIGLRIAYVRSADGITLEFLQRPTDN